MAGKLALISGVVFAGAVGAVIIMSGLRAANPTGAAGSAGNTVGIGATDSSGSIAPLSSGDIQTSAATGSGTGSGHERDEHANRGSSGSRGTEKHSGTSHEEDDDD